jgi:signal transduction histidine kinase
MRGRTEDSRERAEALEEGGGHPHPGISQALTQAFGEFNACSNRLQEAFAALQEEVRSLANELSEKNRVIEALERQAARNERIGAMGELAQRIAHQIRNPLGSIHLYASMLEEDLQGHASRALVHRISAAVQSCDLVVQNLLAFADDLDPVRSVFSLHACLQETVGMAAQLLAARNVRVKLTLEAVETWVDADRDLVRQAVLNLLANAAQATPDGGTVRVITHNLKLAPQEPTWIATSVVDQGPGIAPADVERIFDPLFSTRRGAAGLGLAIVQRVAEAHGGLIEVESRPGCGATFRFSLPVCKG